MTDSANGHGSSTTGPHGHAVTPLELHWPTDAQELAAARTLGLPRLVLVPEGVPAPEVTGDPLEEVLWQPASSVELHHRRTVLQLRAAAQPTRRVPTIDEHGVLRYGEASVPLTPTGAALAALLVARFERVVPRDALVDAAWPGADLKLNTLDVQLGRLRQRMNLVGLTLRTIRQRGYLLAAAERAASIDEAAGPTPKASNEAAGPTPTDRARS